MVFSASLPISAMVSPVRKSESTNDEGTHLPPSVSETRERNNERCIKLERDERDSPTHTQSRTTKTRTTEDEDKEEEEEDAQNSTRR